MKFNKVTKSVLIKKSIITFAIIVSFCTGIYLLYTSQEKNIPDFEIDEDIVEKETKPKQSETTDVTFFTQYIINEKNPSIQLINPNNNTVNMEFSVFIDNHRITKTKLVKPNAAKSLNLKAILKNGLHTMNVEIRTFDINTNKECNSIPVSGIKINVE